MNMHDARQSLRRTWVPEPRRPRLHRDIVLLGASAGGVEALRQVVRGLPEDLPAAVLVVLHLRRDRESCLAAILDRAGPLPVRTAVDGEPLRHRRIYVAPPDRHLLVHGDEVRLDRGGSADRWRPAIDVLFRSAAESHGPRVAAVVMTGFLDDGAVGLARVKAAGGATVVQDPDDAWSPHMPMNAMRSAQPDYRLPLPAIPPVLSWLAGHEAPEPFASGIA